MDDTSARRRLNLWASAPDRHSLLEDAQGVLAGSMLVSLGVTLFSAAGLLTGGTVGLAFLVHYGTDLSFGTVFFLVNLPFYYLAFRRLGLAFTVKTFCAIALTALLSEYMPGFLAFQSINPVAAALFGGLTVAAGMLALFRHRTSLGGFGILALYLQDLGPAPVALADAILGLELIELALQSSNGKCTLNIKSACRHAG